MLNTTYHQIKVLGNKKLEVALAASFLLSLTLFFFGVSQIYYTNILEIPFLISDTWYYFLAISLIIGLSLALFNWRLKEPYHTRAVALVFAVGLLFWIQGNILVWNYGPLDGHEIIWQNYFWNGLIDSMVWIIILVIALRYSKRLYCYIGILCVLLLIMQAGGFAVAAHLAPAEPDWKKVQNSPAEEKMYQFSINKNVIIIILDTYQSNTFQEIIDEDQKYRDMFDGFTYYRNNIGGFPHTYLSVMNILSGKFYNNSVPVREFLNDTSSHSSLPALLKKDGARTDIKSISLQYYGNIQIYDTVDKSPSIAYNDNSIECIPKITSIYELTFFRFVPQALKRYFYLTSIREDDGDDVSNFDMAVYQKFNSAINVSEPENIFKLFHFMGPHAPYHLNDDLKEKRLPQNYLGYKLQAKASLKICSALLESLKEKGGYANSLIFIIGDHGTGRGTDIISGGTPLMLAKNFNSTGPLKISDAPVSLGDIPKTVLEELKIENNFPGCSIFSINETSSRERTFYNYIWQNDLWAEDYLPILREYKINGFSWNTSAWEPTYLAYTSKGIEKYFPQIYTPGSVIYFGIGGNSETFLPPGAAQGWSGPERGFRWTDGNAAFFRFCLLEIKTNLTLNMAFKPFLAGSLKSQRLSIWVNEHRLKDFHLTGGNQNIVIEIPRDYFEGEVQEIIFDLPDATSPMKLKVSDDSRILGLAVRSLSLSPSDDVT